MPARSHRVGWLSVAILFLAAGCDDTPKQAAKPKIQTRETLNKTTQNVIPAAPELAKGAVISTGAITESGPISVQGSAYVSSVGKIGVMAAQNVINEYQALNGKYPKDAEELVNEVLKPNDVRLPQLPYYQEYGYDEKEHKIVVLEYPARKAQRAKERDE